MSEKKYLIIGSVTEQYFRAAEYIQKKYKIEPVLWAAPSSYTNQIHKDFQDRKNEMNSLTIMLYATKQ